MAQYGRPNGVTTVSTWYESGGSSQTNIYTAIDETTRSDTDYIYSTPDGSTTTACKIGLSYLYEPSVNTGHIFRYTYLRSKTNKDATLAVRLIDSSYGTIASWVNANPGGTFSLAEQTLTETQAGNISDYTTLAIEFQVIVATPGGGHIEVSWAEFQIPDGVIHNVVSNVIANA